MLSCHSSYAAVNRDATQARSMPGACAAVHYTRLCPCQQRVHTSENNTHQQHTIRHLHQHQRSRTSVRLQVAISSEPAPAQGSPSPASAVTTLEDLQPGQLVTVKVVPLAATAQHPQPLQTILYLEVIQGSQAGEGPLVAWEGRLMRLKVREDGRLQAVHLGSQLSNRNTANLKAFPALAKLVPLTSNPSPSLPCDQVVLEQLEVVGSLGQLEQAVRDNPQKWCRGTEPGEPIRPVEEYQVQSAGELLSLLTGWRGLVMVQLYVGWDLQLRQPVLNPFVLVLLERVLANKEVDVVTSTVSGGLGVTALVHANKEPFRSWAKYMKGIGAQAAIVAGSPYYQLLIGRMLGYDEANIHHHIKSQPGGQLTPKIIAAVDADMVKISNKKPQLPWTQSSRGKGAKKA